MSATQGWVDTVTGESGTFDKDGKQRSWTRWERITGWWSGLRFRWHVAQLEREKVATDLRFKREAAAAEEKRRNEDWRYIGIIDMRLTRRWYSGKVHTHDYKAPLYVNDSLGRAYIVDSTEGGAHTPIDYRVYKDSGHVITIQ